MVHKPKTDTQPAVPHPAVVPSAEALRRQDSMVGAVLKDKYRITGLLADGGMGRVYSGQHLRLDKKVAVKCVLPLLSADPAVVSRFRAEAEMCAQLSHANVVKLLDFGQREMDHGGELYAVMEFVEGDTLERLFETNHRFSFRRVTSIMEQLLVALDYAHEHGVVHRDIKPANIVIQSLGTTARVILIDFGIAQAEVNSATSTEGMVVGTPEFMAPEQAHGLPATPAVDIYSAGVVMFQLLTGVLPFSGDSVLELFHQHTQAARPDPRQVDTAQQVPDELADICLKALSVDPGDRFASAYEFADAVVHVRRSLRPPRIPSDPADSPRSGTSRLVNTSALTQLAVPIPPRSSTPPIDRDSAPHAVRFPAPPVPAAAGVPQDARASVSQAPADGQDLMKLKRLGREADAHIGAGQLDQALTTLLGGLNACRTVLRRGDRELGQSAARSFADKLSQVYGALGQHERAAAIAGSRSLSPGPRSTPIPSQPDAAASGISGTVSQGPSRLQKSGRKRA